MTSRVQSRKPGIHTGKGYFITTYDRHAAQASSTSRLQRKALASARAARHNTRMSSRKNVDVRVSVGGNAWRQADSRADRVQAIIATAPDHHALQHVPDVPSQRCTLKTGGRSNTRSLKQHKQGCIGRKRQSWPTTTSIPAASAQMPVRLGPRCLSKTALESTSSVQWCGLVLNASQAAFGSKAQVCNTCTATISTESSTEVYQREAPPLEAGQVLSRKGHTCLAAPVRSINRIGLPRKSPIACLAKITTIAHAPPPFITSSRRVLP